MGLLEVLTIIFIVLKLLGVITWSWWLVLLPGLIALGIYVVFYAFFIVNWFRTWRQFDKFFDE